MSDFLSRLKTEKEDLLEKTAKLSSFLTADAFEKLSSANKILLFEQVELMQRYLNVLTIRIELIEK